MLQNHFNYHSIIKKLNQIIDFNFISIEANDKFFDDGLRLKYRHNYMMSFNLEYYEERKHIYQISFKESISKEAENFLESIGFYISQINFLSSKSKDSTGIELDYISKKINNNAHNANLQATINHSEISAKIIFNLNSNYAMITKLLDKINKINKYFEANEKKINESQKIIKSFDQVKKEIEDNKSLSNNLFIIQDIKKFEKFPILFRELNDHFQVFNQIYSKGSALKSIQEKKIDNKKITLSSIRDEYIKFPKFQKLLNSIKNKEKAEVELQNQIDKFKSFPKFYIKLQEELSCRNNLEVDNDSSKIIPNKTLELSSKNQNIFSNSISA